VLALELALERVLEQPLERVQGVLGEVQRLRRRSLERQ
jgi:hypothetical protein